MMHDVASEQCALSLSELDVVPGILLPFVAAGALVTSYMPSGICTYISYELRTNGLWGRALVAASGAETSILLLAFFIATHATREM
jgi:hypothetical protein